MAGVSDALARFEAISANSSLPKVNEKGSKKQLEEVAQEFEAIFVKMMLDSMRKTRHKEDDMNYGGQAEDIFEDMLYTEYSRSMAQRGDFGIADLIVNQYSPSSQAPGNS